MADKETGAQARRLIRALDRATLATSLAPANDGEAWPYASLVLAACTMDASPVLLMSDLAEHARNLARDDRASLLYDGTAGLDDPLTGARVTVLGRITETDDPDLRRRYLERHPVAVDYADFGDFRFFRMTVERAHLVAGFGVIHWIAAPELLFDTAQAGGLARAETNIVAHMNQDHAGAVALYAKVLAGRGGTGWTMTGVDPEGCDLRLGGDVARVDFAQPAATAEAARAALIGLAESARART